MLKRATIALVYFIAGFLLLGLFFELVIKTPVMVFAGGYMVGVLPVAGLASIALGVLALVNRLPRVPEDWPGTDDSR